MFGEGCECSAIVIITFVKIGSVPIAFRVNAVVDEGTALAVSPIDHFGLYYSVVWTESIGLLRCGECHAEHESEGDESSFD